MMMNAVREVIAARNRELAASARTVFATATVVITDITRRVLGYGCC